MRTPSSLILAGILIISVILVLLTLRIPVSVPDQAGLGDIWLGHPFSFVHQDFSGIDPPYFPWDVSFASPWRHGIGVRWSFFLLDVLLVFVMLFVFYILTFRGKNAKRTSANV